MKYIVQGLDSYVRRSAQMGVGMERLVTADTNPSSHILPFLWMKGEDNGTIGEELDRIEECGIREVCLESRPHPDFCGPGWWENVDFILEEARKRGMRVWILDDDKFPTGHCNGALSGQWEKQKVYLAERHVDIMGPCRNNALLVENFCGSDGKLLGILACPKPDGETLAVSGEGIIDLTRQCENGFVYFDLPKGAYRLFVMFTTRKGGGRADYMNLIDTDSVRVLIDAVYEKHYERYKDYFGNTLAGFFSDEPELGNVNGYPFDNTLGKKDTKLPWSGELEEELRAAWGDDFLISLPALWYDSGSRTVAVRSTYMDHMSGLVKKCFSGQLGEWCAQRGVEYIGHIIEDDNAHARMACSIGHYFREMEGQHMAGIDVVHHQIVPGFTEPVHQWIAGDRDGEFFHFGLGKLGSSAAHIDPRKKNRALCEIFGNYGWAEGNSFMRWLTNHMLVRGINEFTPHAFSMNYPDTDCPPHFYARGNHPGFACFTQLMKYMNRAAHLLTGGVHLADAAVLYHGEAEWSGGRTMYFQKPGRVIMEHQLDYDVIPADVLEHGALVSEGCLMIHEERYPCLVLPYAQYLVRKAVDFVIQGAGKGLRVFVVDGLPDGDTEGRAIPQAFAEAVRVVSLKELAGAVREASEDIGPRALTVEKNAPGLRTILFRQRDGLTAMYFNESVDEAVETSILTGDSDYKSVTVYDPWAGKSKTYGITEGAIPLKLMPGEAVFYVLEHSTCGEYKKFPELSGSCKIITDWKVTRTSETDVCAGQNKPFTSERFTPEPAQLDQSAVAVMGDQQEEGILLKAGEELPNLNGRGYWPAFTGQYRYEGSLNVEKLEDAEYFLKLPQAGDCVRVWVNDKDCGYMAGFPSRISLGDALKEGENKLVLEAATTLVWKRKDGASTHLQVTGMGILEEPVLEWFVS